MAIRGLLSLVGPTAPVSSQRDTLFKTELKKAKAQGPRASGRGRAGASREMRWARWGSFLSISISQGSKLIRHVAAVLCLCRCPPSGW
eukprot:scaffold5250_cov102-Isochrysis_galbana.AAC.3